MEMIACDVCGLDRPTKFRGAVLTTCVANRYADELPVSCLFGTDLFLSGATPALVWTDKPNMMSRRAIRLVNLAEFLDHKETSGSPFVDRDALGKRLGGTITGPCTILRHHVHYAQFSINSDMIEVITQLRDLGVRDLDWGITTVRFMDPKSIHLSRRYVLGFPETLLSAATILSMMRV